MKNPFERSAETTRIVNYLRSMEKNAQVTYDELFAQVSIPITARTPKLIHARRILQRDHNAIWACVKPSIGLRRLNDVEIAERLQPWWMRGARNKLKRAGREIEVVDTEKLNIDQLAKFGVDCMQRELAFTSLSKATARRMERIARGNSNDLPSFNIVEWAINLSPRRAPPER
jgi:hypothetical protein